MAKEVKEYVKRFLSKDKFVFILSLMFLLTLLISILNKFNVSLGSNIFTTVINLFPFGIYIFLSIMIGISAILAYYEKYTLMFIPIMIWLLFTTVVVRTSNIPGLKNAATGEWVLGPDLDPFLFLRNAIEIYEGRGDYDVDVMRYAPLGTGNVIKGSLMPQAIVFIHSITSMFHNQGIVYSAIIAPVIFFTLSIIGFFFFVYVLFSFKFSKRKSLVAATIASFLYSFTPQMLHRTIAGIPELESLGMLFFWPAFLFFALAWKQDKTRKMIISGILAGIFTGLMAWSWGGYKYIYMILSLSALLVFLFEKEKIKNFIVFGSWLITTVVFDLFRGIKFSSILGSLTDSGFALFVLILLGFNILLFTKKFELNKKLKLNKIKLPENIQTILILLLFSFFILLIIKPEFITNTFSYIFERLLYPFGRERVGLTVAENRAPYFTEVLSNFGNLFWLFFFGTIFLFYDTIKHFDLKKKVILNSFFVLFLVSFTFSRISSNHRFNGENPISIFVYFAGLIAFILVLFFIYINSYKKDKETYENFRKIEFSYLLMISLAILAIISMRGAVRLFFIIAPIIIINAVYFILKLYENLKSKDEVLKIINWGLFVISILLLLSSLILYSNSTVQSSKYTVPSIYNKQWHYAMDWVATETPEGSIFTHWWDYGYWVQTLGQRPTVSDGGHFTSYWDHTVGRYLLTTPYPETALSLMKSHNVSYLLIDSSDLGKYPAYAKIGSNENWDRYSYISIFVSDPSQKQETKTGMQRAYMGGWAVDEDIIYDKEDKKILLPGMSFNEFGEASTFSYLAGLIFETSELNNEVSFNQPQGVFFYNNQRYDLPIRYIYYNNNNILDFGAGLNSIVMIIPKVEQESTGAVTIDNYGAVVYLSERTKDSLFAQLYLMNDVNKRYETIRLAHSEEDYVISFFKQQGIDIGDFAYFEGFKGPIKIWEIDYPENTLIREEFLELSGEYAGLDELKFTQ